MRSVGLRTDHNISREQGTRAVSATTSHPYDIVAGNKRQRRAWVRQGKLFRKVQHNAMHCRLRFLGWICQIYFVSLSIIIICVFSATHLAPTRKEGKKKDRLLGCGGGRGRYQNGGLVDEQMNTHSPLLSAMGAARGWGRQKGAHVHNRFSGHSTSLQLAAA